MTQRFRGQTAFVTGASSGIGAALALAFAEEGARVVLAARRVDKLEEVRRKIEEKGGTALAIPCDVTDAASIGRAVGLAVETFGGIDIAVANAGIVITEDFENLNTGDFRRIFDTNFFGVVDTVYAILPHLKASKGRLGIVSSIMGQIAAPMDTAYCATKFALAGFAGSLYYELPKGVSVTLIMPLLVESETCHRDKSVLGADHKERSPSFLIVPAERAAQEILRAMYRRRFEAVIPCYGGLIAFGSRHFPFLFRQLVMAWRHFQTPRGR